MRRTVGSLLWSFEYPGYSKVRQGHGGPYPGPDVFAVMCLGGAEPKQTGLHVQYGTNKDCSSIILPLYSP